MSNPHEVDEDPEQHIGEPMRDPWEDPEQTDWPMAKKEDDDGVDGSSVSR
jgi:hypothetical protein